MDETEEQKADRIMKELIKQEAAEEERLSKQSKKSLKKARQRESERALRAAKEAEAAEVAAKAAKAEAARLKAEEVARLTVEAKAAAARAAEMKKAEEAAELEKKAREETAAEAAEMEKLKKCCEGTLADAKQKMSASASPSSSAQDREPETESSWKTVSSSKEKLDRSKDKRQSQRQQLSITQRKQAADKNDLLKIIKIAIENELKRDNILTPQTIKGNKTMGFIDFSPNILNFPNTSPTGGHITIMPNNETNENGSHITITLPAPWTPGAGQGGKLHIYRNGTFNVKWYNHYVGDRGPQAARPDPEDLSILTLKNWEKIYSKLTREENGLRLQVKGVAVGQAMGPRNINFGVNCAQCGELQDGDVNNVNSSRTEVQFYKMMRTLRLFMDAVNKVLNNKEKEIQNILSQKGGKKTRKQRKQRKQKTKGKKSKARKSKRVKKKTRKYK